VILLIMTDNGSAYKSFAFRDLLAEQAIRHKRTRPYTPRTNGKAERFIQTSLREWAYAQPYSSSAERTKTLEPWLQIYNTTRTHSGIKHMTPFARLNNVLGFDTSIRINSMFKNPLATTHRRFGPLLTVRAGGHPSALSGSPLTDKEDTGLDLLKTSGALWNSPLHPLHQRPDTIVHGSKC
jgi:hypothetical protein